MSTVVQACACLRNNYEGRCAADVQRRHWTVRCIARARRVGSQLMTPILSVGCGRYTVSGSIGGVPTIYALLIEHAALHDDLGIRGSDGTALVISVQLGSGAWPELLVAQRFRPGPEAGFQPGVLLVPETHLLLIGAGERLLAYDLRGPAWATSTRTPARSPASASRASRAIARANGGIAEPATARLPAPAGGATIGPP
jgi:hypothetical protein